MEETFGKDAAYALPYGSTVNLSCLNLNNTDIDLGIRFYDVNILCKYWNKPFFNEEKIDKNRHRIYALRDLASKMEKKGFRLLGSGGEAAVVIIYMS